MDPKKTGTAVLHLVVASWVFVLMFYHGPTFAATVVCFIKVSGALVTASCAAAGLINLTKSYLGVS